MHLSTSKIQGPGKSGLFHFMNLSQEAYRSMIAPFGIETIINKTALAIPLINTAVDPDEKMRVITNSITPAITFTKRAVRVTSAVATAATVTIIAPIQ